MITTWVYSMDATMNMTDDLKKMSVDDANVQTTHKENAVSRINRAAFESGIDPMDPCGRMFDEHIKWSNSPTKRQC